MSMVRRARLKGSVGSLRRWRVMAERSMVLFDEGKMTGSSMSSNVIGSDA
jgi:hypothetical protein